MNRAVGAPEGRDGQAFNQAIHTRFARHATVDRSRPDSIVRYHTLLSLRELGHCAEFPDGQLQ